MRIIGDISKARLRPRGGAEPKDTQAYLPRQPDPPLGRQILVSGLMCRLKTLQHAFKPSLRLSITTTTTHILYTKCSTLPIIIRLYTLINHTHTCFNTLDHCYRYPGNHGVCYQTQTHYHILVHLSPPINSFLPIYPPPIKDTIHHIDKYIHTTILSTIDISTNYIPSIQKTHFNIRNMHPLAHSKTQHTPSNTCIPSPLPTTAL